MRVDITDLLKDTAKCATIGERLRQIKEEEAFTTVVRYLKEQYRDMVMATLPHETQARQEAYLMHKALDDVLATINSFVLLADQYRVEHGLFEEPEE